MKTIDLYKKISKYVDSELIKIRRSLHKIPEIGFKEFETSKFIQRLFKGRDWHSI